MSDSIYAMANGTAVDSVLDRTLKNKGSVNVMKKEAAKMKQAGKITQAEYDKVTSYGSKNDYQKDENNKTIHENGTITKGSEKKFKAEVKGTTAPGQAGGYQPASGGSSGGNTGSESKKDKKIICTEMYRQTNLDDWKTAIKIWGFHTKTHLTKFHQKGYHFLFMPWVKGMRKSKSLTKSGGWLAQRRTQHLKYILSRDVYNKDKMFYNLGIKPNEKDDVVGRLWCTFWHPITFITGKILTFLNKKDL